MPSPKIVLTADRTLMSPYRKLSLATFFGCAPALDPHRDPKSFWYKILGRQVTPKILFDFICNYIPHTNGVADYAPYGLRKVEAGLLRDGFKREEVVVAHPDHIEKFIGPHTEVVGTYEMDPLGMGPVTMTFTYGRKQMSYDEFYNREMHQRINAAKEKTGSHAKVIAGASGTWQYNYDPAKIEEYGLYAILEGELGGIAPEIDGHAGRFFRYLINGDFDNMDPFRKRKDFKIDIKEFKREEKTYHGRFVNFWDRPDLDEIPDIVEPSMHGMVEVMRGCGRGCKFCDVTLRSLRYYSPEKVKREIEVNIKKGGTKSAWIHSDDIFVYGMDPHTAKNMEPNREAMEDLFKAIMSTGVEHTNPTHGTLAGAIADEKHLPNYQKVPFGWLVWPCKWLRSAYFSISLMLPVSKPHCMPVRLSGPERIIFDIFGRSFSSAMAPASVPCVGFVCSTPVDIMALNKSSIASLFGSIFLAVCGSIPYTNISSL